VCEWKC